MAKIQNSSATEGARRGRRAAIGAAIAIALLGGAATAVTYGPGQDAPWRQIVRSHLPWGAPATAETITTLTEPVTTPVQFTTLTNELRLNASLGFGQIEELPAAAGMLTVLPTAGAVIEQGQEVFEADGAPVVLFTGERPFWRDITWGVNGEDTRQLQQNLHDLGYLRAEPNGRFGQATAAAISAWQRDLGVPRTGVFTPASVVVTPAPSIRIATVTAKLGTSDVSPGTYSETTVRAVATLTEAQSRQLTAGTPVTVTLPNGTEIDTALAAVDLGGQLLDDGTTAPPTATIEFDDQEAVAAAGQSAVRVLVHDDEQRPATLVVPATSLVATAGGGFAVEIWDGTAITRVPVEIGLVADARVQILASGADVPGGSGPGLQAGDLVVLAR